MNLGEGNMISLEQVLMLESKVAKAIDYVKKVTAENAALVAEREGLQAKLNANQKRIDELEVHVMRFKEDQSRIEDGIIAALDRLSQFEEAFENSLKDKPAAKKPAAKTQEKQEAAAPADSKEIFFEINESSETTANASAGGGELDIF
jgi:predicted nuclease with TOPRIM domain